MISDVLIRTCPQRRQYRSQLEAELHKAGLLTKARWEEQPGLAHDPDWWLRMLTKYSAGDSTDWLLILEDDVAGINRHLEHNLAQWAAPRQSDFGLGWLTVSHGIAADALKLFYKEAEGQRLIIRAAESCFNSGAVLIQRGFLYGIIRFTENNPWMFMDPRRGGLWRGPVAITYDIGLSFACTLLGKRVYLHAAPTLVKTSTSIPSLLEMGKSRPFGELDYAAYDEEYRSEIARGELVCPGA